jgi:hypothetical protein
MALERAGSGAFARATLHHAAKARGDLAICNGDVARLYGNVPPGRERILECLGAQAGSLSPECYRAIARVSGR